ncbi:MAG: hypothetical protein EBR82_68645 [Caulobacteraceae bacterium]|nr:hypothetical protein [Caulobacteraceae bacterium]
MKSKSLESKLEEYYYKLQNPSLVIDNWSIVDIVAFNKLNKITLTNINEVNNNLTERLITTENKNNYIVIKYSPNFIATKVINKEYDYLLKDWDLIAIDKNSLYVNKPNKLMTNKEIIKLLGLKLTKRAKANLEYFS